MPKYRLKPKTVEGFIAPCKMSMDGIGSGAVAHEGDLVVKENGSVIVIPKDELEDDYEEVTAKGRKKRASDKTVKELHDG